MVVFHLHGQTSRSKAWANGTQNSRPWWISSRNHVYHLYKSDPFTGKRPRRPETGIKVDFEEMEHSFPFGIFRPEKQDYLFRCFVAPANFPLERSKKSCSIHFPTGFPGQFWWMVNNPFLLTLLENFLHSFFNSFVLTEVWLYSSPMLRYFGAMRRLWYPNHHWGMTHECFIFY